MDTCGYSENLNVSSIAYDPNNTNIFYLGTGESYVGHTAGAINGDGVWKSEDGGTTWTNIFGGNTGDSYFQSGSFITVNSPVAVSGNYQSFPTTAFGPEITSTITADIVLVDDGTGAPTEGCNALVNAASVNGKIALIRRANCNFTVKVKNAQNAGAVGVIMMNNVPGQPVPMGGSDNTITIPSVMISQSDGDILEAAVNGGTVNGSLVPATGDFTATVVPGIQHINDIVVRDMGTTSEVYIAAGEAIYGVSNAGTTIGGTTYGVYRSTDNGNTWTQATVPQINGHAYEPNDIAIGADNKIWMATVNSGLYGDGGGAIFSSTNGTSFDLIFTIPNASRTQIEASATDPNKLYMLADGTDSSAPVLALFTSSAFTSPRNPTLPLSLPNDADSGIPDEDFTRGQAFYDLVIKAHPTNDDNVFVGGINIFESDNSGNAWTQRSMWFGGTSFPEVHADQHAIAFGHNDPNKMLFGNDGGVFYSPNGGLSIVSRNREFNVTQFYTVGVAPTAAISGDYFAAGAQDNGTQFFANANPGINASVESQGGDGAGTDFDQDGTDTYYVSNFVYNASIWKRNYVTNQVTLINSESGNNGDFINQQALDSNFDLLYTNYTSQANGPTIRRYNIANSTIEKDELTDATTLTTTPIAFKVSPYTTTSSKLLVGTQLGDIILVENANTASPTWTALDNNIIVGSVSDIEYGQSEDDIFVTTHNYGVNNVWYSGDAGATWEPKDGNLPDLPVKAILQNPLNLEEVIIGTELGVWYTNDFSSENPTWRQSFNGMSNVKVLDLDLRDDNVVFAATHGRGVFSGSFLPGSLSVEEFENDTFTVYPNPSNGSFNVSAVKNYGDAIATIYDINGRKVFSSNIVLDQNTQINAGRNLSNGFYILKIQGADFSHAERLVIKK